MPSTPDRVFRLAGRLVSPRLRPLQALVVRAFDDDPGRDPDPLGEPAVTDDEGRFAITFTAAEAGGRGEGAPEVFVRVSRTEDEGGAPVLESSPVRVEGDHLDLGTIEVRLGEPVPDDSGMGGTGPLHDVQDVHSPSVHGRTPRGLLSVPRSPSYRGRFGRLFRRLAPLNEPPDEQFEALAGTMFEPGADTWTGEPDPDLDNPGLPAGYTYFGQFVDHDVTFDPTSSLQRANDPNALENFRTPRFDLDSLYGRGPHDAPYLYQPGGLRFAIGRIAGGEADCLRSSPTLPDGATDADRRRSRRALIGDPRNDENLVVNQLHLAVLKYHNAVVDELEDRGDVPDERLFDEAARVVRWHYQWAVVHDFLPRIAGADVVGSLFSHETYPVYQGGQERLAKLRTTNLQFYRWKNEPWMPVEFSVAAYRFGHTMIRPAYAVNDGSGQVDIFSPRGDADELADLRGFRERPAGRQVAWERFFPFADGDAAKLQASRRMDTRLAPGLRDLPFERHLRSLAARNLLRGKALGLPSGQDVAVAMGMPPELVLGRDRMGLDGPLADAFGHRTPLWYYVLQEASELGDGERLGPVGGRIVAEVLVGLLLGDPNSFLASPDMWEPKAGEHGATEDGVFAVPDLLRHGGAPITG